MKLNSKGITIIELLLGTVLFSFVALGVTFFISTGTKTCNNAEETINIQEESQTVSNQLVNHSLEGNGLGLDDTDSDNICFMIYKTDKNTGETTEEIILYFKKSSNELYYYEVDSSTEAAVISSIRTEIDGSSSSIVYGQLLGEYITDFKVTITGKNAVFKLTYNLNGKTIQVQDSVSIRSKQVDANSPII